MPSRSHKRKILILFAVFFPLITLALYMFFLLDDFQILMDTCAPFQSPSSELYDASYQLNTSYFDSLLLHCTSLLCEGTKRDAIPVLRHPHPDLETLAALPFANKDIIADFLRNRHQIRSELNSTNRFLHTNVQCRLSEYHYVERQLRDQYGKEQQEQEKHASTFGRDRTNKKEEEEEEEKESRLSDDDGTTLAKKPEHTQRLRLVVRLAGERIRAVILMTDLPDLYDSMQRHCAELLEYTTSAIEAGYADLEIQVTMLWATRSQLAVAQLDVWPFLGFDARKMYMQPIREMERQKVMVEGMIEWLKGDREEMEAVGEALTKVQGERERLELVMWRKDGGPREQSGSCIGHLQKCFTRMKRVSSWVKGIRQKGNGGV